VQVNVFGTKDAADADLFKARAVFQEALRHRSEFVGDFLSQALRQASATFRLSLIFMGLGGVIVLTAGGLALTNAFGPANHTVALVSGIAGTIIGVCGAAFSRKADQARKHLAEQAERMHSQLIDERKYLQVADLLVGVKDANLNDRARISLALRIMGDEKASSNVVLQAEEDT